MQKQILFPNNTTIGSKNGIMIILDYDRNHKWYYCKVFLADIQNKGEYSTYTVDLFDNNTIRFDIKKVNRFSKKVMDKYEKIVDNLDKTDFINLYLNCITHNEIQELLDYMRGLFDGI